jgi:hypothetical protein
MRAYTDLERWSTCEKLLGRNPTFAAGLQVREREKEIPQKREREREKRPI